MLTTIARGKAGRVVIPGTESSLSWRDVFRRNEDLLTGVLFSRLRFLSSQGLVRVMALLLGHDNAHALGDFQSIEFWPRLEKLQRRVWVEPDVLMRFSEAFVIVEVKPPFGGNQSVEQWRAEVEALIAEGELGEASTAQVLHFIALGNTGRQDGEISRPFETASEAVDIRFHCREWGPLSQAVPKLANESVGSDAAVFDDWLEAFTLFGISSRPPVDWTVGANWMGDRTLSLDLSWMKRGNRKSEALLIIDRSRPLSNWSDLEFYSKQNVMEWPLWMSPWLTRKNLFGMCK
jgi:hypothetical protein